MELAAVVRAELDRHDWAALECMCLSSAEHVPMLFEVILGPEPNQVGYHLTGHIEDGGLVAECSGPAVGVIVAALAAGAGRDVRGQLLDLLAAIARGVGYYAGTDDPLAAECRARAQEGYWTLVSIGLSGDREDAAMVADICEQLLLGDERTSEYYLRLLRERVAAKSKRRRQYW